MRMSHQGCPKDPSGQGGGEWNCVRGQLGPPSLRRQSGHLSKASFPFHSCLDAAIRVILPSPGWESGCASFPPVSDLAFGVI